MVRFHDDLRGSSMVAPLRPNDSLSTKSSYEMEIVESDDGLAFLSLASRTSDGTAVESEGNAMRLSYGTNWSLGRAKGLGFVVLAAFNFSAVAACVKFASKRVSSHEIVFWRMLVAFVLNIIWLCCKKRGVLIGRKHWNILLFRCFVSTVGVSLKYYAMSRMVLTDAVVIIMTSPIFTFFLGAAFLGEAIDGVALIAGATSFAGVLFVTRPEFMFPVDKSTQSPPAAAIICALAGAMTQAIVYVSIRRMRDLDSLVVIHYFLIFGTCYAAISMWTFGEELQVPLEPWYLFAIIGSGFFSYVGQIFLMLGFQCEKAGIASVMRYFDVVFVLIWDITVLGEHVSMYSILGAGVIISGASLIVMRRARSDN